MRRVVLPGPRHRVGIALVAWRQCQGPTRRVNPQGSASGGVDADADDVAGRETPVRGRLLNGGPDPCVHAGQMIGRVLAGPMRIVAVVDDAAFAARGFTDRLAEFSPVAPVHDEGADGVGAKI